MQTNRHAVSDIDTKTFLAGPQTAGALAIPAEALPQSMTCGEVFAWLLENSAVPAVAILDKHNCVAGLINRLIFLARYAQQYAPELTAASPSCAWPIPRP